MNERIDELYSLHILLIQNSSVFSFSTDAVLLAYFTKLRRRQSSVTVDLCAGNGAVGLFLSRKTAGRIVGIEIQPKLANMARRSIRLNHLENRILVHTMDLKDALKVIPKHSVDVVTCNPPYFRNLPTSRENPNPYFAIAKYEINTNLDEILWMTNQLLKIHGRVDLVYRPERLSELIIRLQKYHLAPKRLQFVYTRKSQPAKMFLIEATKCGKLTGLQILPPLITMSGDHYSPKMHRIMFNPW